MREHHQGQPACLGGLEDVSGEVASWRKAIEGDVKEDRVKRVEHLVETLHKSLLRPAMGEKDVISCIPSYSCLFFHVTAMTFQLVQSDLRNLTEMNELRVVTS